MKMDSLILLKFRPVRLRRCKRLNIESASQKFGRATSGTNCKSSVFRWRWLAISKRDSVKSRCQTFVSLSRLSFLRYLWNFIAEMQPFSEAL